MSYAVKIFVGAWLNLGFFKTKKHALAYQKTVDGKTEVVKY